MKVPCLPSCTVTTVFVAATVSAGLAKKKTLSQGLEEMDRIAGEVLDDNFKTTLRGVQRILWRALPV